MFDEVVGGVARGSSRILRNPAAKKFAVFVWGPEFDRGPRFWHAKLGFQWVAFIPQIEY